MSDFFATRPLAKETKTKNKLKIDIFCNFLNFCWLSFFESLKARRKSFRQKGPNCIRTYELNLFYFIFTFG